MYDQILPIQAAEEELIVDGTSGIPAESSSNIEINGHFQSPEVVGTPQINDENVSPNKGNG